MRVKTSLYIHSVFGIHQRPLSSRLCQEQGRTGDSSTFHFFISKAPHRTLPGKWKAWHLNQERPILPSLSYEPSHLPYVLIAISCSQLERAIDDGAWLSPPLFPHVIGQHREGPHAISLSLHLPRRVAANQTRHHSKRHPISKQHCELGMKMKQEQQRKATIPVYGISSADADDPGQGCLINGQVPASRSWVWTEIGGGRSRDANRL